MIFYFLFRFLAAAPAYAGSSSQGGPSVSTNIQNPAALVNAVYNYAFAIGGLLAFGAVVYGAVRLTFSAGNPSAQTDARDQITQALLGLALLLGAYTVLNTISPNLVNLKLPSLEKVRIPTSTVPGSGRPRECAHGGTECLNGYECVEYGSGRTCLASGGNQCGASCKAPNVCVVEGDAVRCLAKAGGTVSSTARCADGGAKCTGLGEICVKRHTGNSCSQEAFGCQPNCGSGEVCVVAGGETVGCFPRVY